MAPPPPQKKGGANVKVILAVVIGLGVVCSGGLGIVILWGLNMVEADIANQLRENPVLVEKIGTVQNIKMNKSASLKYDDSNIWVYDVEGTLGSGTLKVRSVTSMASENEQIDWALLELPDGSEHVLMGSPPVDI